MYCCRVCRHAAGDARSVAGVAPLSTIDRRARRPARIDPLPPTTRANSSRKSQPYPFALTLKIASEKS